MIMEVFDQIIPYLVIAFLVGALGGWLFTGPAD